MKCPKSQRGDSAQPGLVSVSRTQLGPATLCGLRVIQGKLCRCLQPHGHFMVSCALDVKLRGWDFGSEERSPDSCWLGLVGGFRNRRGLEGHQVNPLVYNRHDRGLEGSRP